VPKYPTLDEVELFESLLSSHKKPNGAIEWDAIFSGWTAAHADSLRLGTKSRKRVGVAAHAATLKALHEHVKKRAHLLELLEPLGDDLAKLDREKRQAGFEVPAPPVAQARPRDPKPKSRPSPEALASSALPLAPGFVGPLGTPYFFVPSMMPAMMPAMVDHAQQGNGIRQPAATPVKRQRAVQTCGVCNRNKFDGTDFGDMHSSSTRHLASCLGNGCMMCNPSFCTVPEIHRLSAPTEKKSHKKKKPDQGVLGP
jgi:hypothetical protein